MDNLEPLQLRYFKKHNLMSIAPVKRFPEVVCTMDEQFNNFPFTGKVQIIYTILDEEETHLYAIIQATLEQINTISQKQKSLETREKKLGQVFQTITKVLQDLKVKENMIRQTKNSIKKLDKKIIEA